MQNNKKNSEDENLWGKMMVDWLKFSDAF